MPAISISSVRCSAVAAATSAAGIQTPPKSSKMFGMHRDCLGGGSASCSRSCDLGHPGSAAFLVEARGASCHVEALYDRCRHGLSPGFGPSRGVGRRYLGTP